MLARFIEKYKKIYQVEVDALPARKPKQFRKMVIDNIDKYYDQDIYEKVSKKYSPENIRKLVKEKIRKKFGN